VLTLDPSYAALADCVQNRFKSSWVNWPLPAHCTSRPSFDLQFTVDSSLLANSHENRGFTQLSVSHAVPSPVKAGQEDDRRWERGLSASSLTQPQPPQPRTAHPWINTGVLDCLLSFLFVQRDRAGREERTQTRTLLPGPWSCSCKPCHPPPDSTRLPAKLCTRWRTKRNRWRRTRPPKQSKASEAGEQRCLAPWLQFHLER